MQVWLFDIMMWPYPGERTAYPYPGRLYDRALGREFYQDHLRYFVRAEELGYDGVCFAEHHYGLNGMCPSPNVMAAAVAARTSRVKLVMMGNCLPMHGHPVRVAEELALLDNLSDGRLVAGCIRGGFTEHFAYSIDLAESRARFEEAWQLIIRAWTDDEPFAWEGQHYHYETVSILPRPVQQPYPPLIMAAHTPESVEWAARQRVPLASSFGATEVLARTFDYYRQYAQAECGWTPGPEHCLISRQVYVGDTNARAREEVEEHLLTFYRESPVIRPMEGKLAEMRRANMTVRSADHYPGHRGGAPAATAAPPRPASPPEITFERFQREGYCIVGDPDHVIAEMRRQQQALGVGTFMLYNPFGTMPIAQATHSLELFAREVLPHVRDDAPTHEAARATVAPGLGPEARS